jgi:hypothetical protein
MFHFLCCDRKHRSYLDHNLNNYVPHSCSRCGASVNLKPAEETLNTVKEINELAWLAPTSLAVWESSV